MPAVLRVLAPAKINLDLRVGKRRPGDGFHPLLSWVSSIGLFDTLEFERARGQSVEASRAFELRIADADRLDRATSPLPADTTGNLVYQAAVALAEFVQQ